MQGRSIFHESMRELVVRKGGVRGVGVGVGPTVFEVDDRLVGLNEQFDKLFLLAYDSAVKQVEVIIRYFFRVFRVIFDLPMNRRTIRIVCLVIIERHVLLKPPKVLASEGGFAVVEGCCKREMLSA